MDLAMTNEPDFVAANAASNAEFSALVGRLTDADLARDLGEGWTVAAMLAHLAIFDFRAAALLDRWQRTGQVVASPLDADLINAATAPLFQAIPPRRAVELALAAAAAADQRIAAIDAGFLARIDAAGRPILLNRSGHRREHIAQIEAALNS
jgi:hypothetical protein